MIWREYKAHIANSYTTFEPFETSPASGSYTRACAEAKAWCQDQFGLPSQRWWVSGLMISFRDQTDATAFKLRWC